jgi:hypothetical protein
MDQVRLNGAPLRITPSFSERNRLAVAKVFRKRKKKIL